MFFGPSEYMHYAALKAVATINTVTSLLVLSLSLSSSLEWSVEAKDRPAFQHKSQIPTNMEAYTCLLTSYGGWQGKTNGHN